MMRKKLAGKLLHEESGAILVFLACTLAALTVCLGITIDLGNTFLTQLRMRSAVDLAAAAITSAIPSENTTANNADIESTVSSVISANHINLSDMEYTCDILTKDNYIYAVRILMSRQVHHFFSTFYSNSSSSITVGDFVYISLDDASELGYTVRVVNTT